MPWSSGKAVFVFNYNPSSGLNRFITLLPKQVSPLLNDYKWRTERKKKSEGLKIILQELLENFWATLQGPTEKLDSRF